MTAFLTAKQAFSDLPVRPVFQAPTRPGRPRKLSAQGFLPIFAALGEQASRSLPVIPLRTASGHTPCAVLSHAAASADEPIDGSVEQLNDQLTGGPLGRQVPAAEASAAITPALDDDSLLEWLAGAERQIRGHARKYLSHSPYEMEEFVQQAHETALTARDVALRKGAPFEKVFWSSFRIACIHMTYTCGRRDKISHEEYQESGDEDALATRTPAELLTGGEDILDVDGRPGTSGPFDGLSTAQRKTFARQILDLMTPRERLAWEYALKGKTRRQTARIMGATRQCVQNLLRRGINRAKRLAVPSSRRPPVVRSPRRPRTVLRTAPQYYLPIIEKSFSRKRCSA